MHNSIDLKEGIPYFNRSDSIQWYSNEIDDAPQPDRDFGCNMSPDLTASSKS